VEDVKPVLLGKKKSDFNRQPFWGGGFLPGWIVKHADFIWFESSRVRYQLVLGFKLSVRCRIVAVWWMADRRSFCFNIAFHNYFTALKNWLTYQCPSSWPVVITMKKKLAGTWKKNRILASPNSWQQVRNRSNPEESCRSCEGVDFSWLSSKVSWTCSPPSYAGPACPATPCTQPGQLPVANPGRWFPRGASMAQHEYALGPVERPSDRGPHPVTSGWNTWGEATWNWMNWMKAWFRFSSNYI
jgi:hypothetical protein